MCRSTPTDQEFESSSHRNRQLQIRAFYLRFTIMRGGVVEPFPEIITLHYLPRISETPLDINDSKIRSDSDAFITLHRLRSAEKQLELVYSARERVRVGEAVRFDVYIGEDKVLKGIFRKDQQYWRVQCECALLRENIYTTCCSRIMEAEVSVLAAHGHVVDKVDMRNRKKRCKIRRGLDDIPEEREEELQLEIGCDCCCDHHDHDNTTPIGDEDSCIDMEIDGVRWAVDVGIWVMCFGVGYLVSRASLTRRLIL